MAPLLLGSGRMSRLMRMLARPHQRAQQAADPTGAEQRPLAGS
jgi:hypothetical protein